jgi:hypothetical protein
MFLTNLVKYSLLRDYYYTFSFIILSEKQDPRVNCTFFSSPYLSLTTFHLYIPSTLFSLSLTNYSFLLSLSLSLSQASMGRSPCCEKEHTNKGAWTKEEDERLINYIKLHGEGCWRSLPKAAGNICI